MSKTEELEAVGPYDKHVCHFCGCSYEKSHKIKDIAGYQRPDNSKPRGQRFDCCEKCARAYTPEQPEQFKKEEVA